LVKGTVLVLSFAVVVIGLIVLFGLLDFKFNKGDDSSDAFNDSDSTAKVFFDSQWYEKKDSLETILFIGIDTFGEIEAVGNSQQSDFLALMVIDHADKKLTVLHINRDTMADIPTLDIANTISGYITGQLALAHTYGSQEVSRCNNTIRAVESLLYDIDIDHCISLTMDAVAIINDGAGGVTLPLLDDFTHINEEYTKGKTVTLTGDDALSYIRARGGMEDSSNLARMERQKQYIGELFKKYSSTTNNDESSMKNVFLDVAKYIYTDYTTQQLSDLREEIKGYEFSEDMSLGGEAVKGEQYMEYYLDEESAQRTVIELFYKASD